MKFRNAIDKVYDNSEFDNDAVLCRFPEACCGDASAFLGNYLLEHGIQTNRVCGIYYGNDEQLWRTHAWLTYGNLILDITGDQFSNNSVFLNFDYPVYIGYGNRFYELFEYDGKRDAYRSSSIDEMEAVVASSLSDLYKRICKYL